MAKTTGLSSENLAARTWQRELGSENLGSENLGSENLGCENLGCENLGCENTVDTETTH
ncbi:hypothetical protein [Planctomycetes bacterium TBK1r]|uniref:hypothetical protein n=1 Tax=Stieleria magnilauensis TaxID=2527963 RepID=UPI0011A9E705